MHLDSVDYLICPACGNIKLNIEKYSFDRNEIHEGRIICQVCNVWYRIENGIADLLPLNIRELERHRAFAEKHNILSYKNQTMEVVDGKTSQIDFFEENADDYEREVVNSRYYKALDQITFIEWINKNLKAGQIVLDLGCGTGRQDIPLAQHKIKTMGIDISEDMVRLAKKKIDALGLNGYIDLIVGDAENPPVRDNSFHACFFYGSLHHLPNKYIAIANASKKIIYNGFFYSLDPHKSPVRFIFDFLMKIWKLYDEEASDDPLISEEQMRKWLFNAGIKGDTRLSTYLPPHLFYFFNHYLNIKLLKVSDMILYKIPIARKLGGVIITEGVKEDKL